MKSISKHVRSSMLLALVGGALIFAAPTDAHAQAPRPVPVKNTAPPAVGKVGLQLRVVHANNSGKVDPRLRNVVDNLKFTRFNGFALLDSNEVRLAPGQSTTFAVVGGRKVKVTLQERDARAAKVRVVMFNPQGKAVMDTTVKIHRNRAFMIAGPNYKDGKLVLPIAVRY